MLYECNILHADGNRQYFVEADNYGEAEKRFNDYARKNIAGDYELTGINRHSKQEIANTNKVVECTASDKKRRIGFNAINLDRMLMTSGPSYKTQSDIIINF